MAPSAVSPRTHVSVPGPAVSGTRPALTECCWPQWMIWESPPSALWTANRGSHSSPLVCDATSCGKFHEDNSLGAVELYCQDTGTSRFFSAEWSVNR